VRFIFLHKVIVVDLVAAYSSDAVYLYSTYDPPETDQVARTSILSPNKQTDASKTPTAIAGTESTAVIPSTDMEHSPWIAADQLLGDDDDTSELSDADDEDEVSDLGNEIHSDVSVVLPRSRFTGHCNVATVKDGQFSSPPSERQFHADLTVSPVNFLGPNDEYVTSGSDDGNFFIWRKATGKLHGILEGDSSVVNVIEPHPRLPLIAVSGIDTTVKVKNILLPLLSISLTSSEVVCTGSWPKQIF
jgi:WD40 repeat protein